MTQKVSIPKLRSITPKRATGEDARCHLRDSGISLLGDRNNPVIGYALVTIHAANPEKPNNYAYSATWHMSMITAFDGAIIALFDGLPTSASRPL